MNVGHARIESACVSLDAIAGALTLYGGGGGFSRRTTSALLGLALMATTFAAAQGPVTLRDGLTLTDASLCPSAWSHGMIVRRFIIENSTPLSRSVTVDIPGTSYQTPGLRALTATVVVGAGMRASLALPQPPVNLSGVDNSVGIRVGNGPRTVERVNASPSQTFLQMHVSRYAHHRSEGALSVVVSRQLSAEALKTRLLACASESATGGSRRSAPSARKQESGDELDELAAQHFTRENMEKLTPYRFEAMAAAWPDTWLAFSSVDGCLIDARDFSEMPATAREALRAYTVAGGQVTFLGMATIPEEWCETAPRSFESGAWHEAPLGFGAVRAIAAADFSDVSSNGIVRLCGGWYAVAKPLTEIHRASGTCLTEIPVAGNLRIPVGRFLLILFAFAVLAGPVAVLYTSRKNRRIWLLALVPGVSFLFSAAILVFALVSEGITPSLRRQALTLLDQPRRQAATLGAVGIYAPVSLRDGLYFDGDTEVTPLSAVRAGRIVRGQGQHYADGWVTPRLPAFFSLRRSEPRGERLLVEEHATQVEVVNALGAPILKLWLCDGGGRLYETDDVGPGEKRVLETLGPRGATTASPTGWSRHCFSSGTPGWKINTRIDALLSQSVDIEPPEPGTYVAILDGCPFLENPLTYCRTKGSERSIVVGRY